MARIVEQLHVRSAYHADPAGEQGHRWRASPRRPTSPSGVTLPSDSDDALQPNYLRADRRADRRRSRDRRGRLRRGSFSGNRRRPAEAHGYFASIGRRSVPDPSRAVSFTELLDEGVPPYAGAIRREAWDAHGGYDPAADDVEPDWCSGCASPPPARRPDPAGQTRQDTRMRRDSSVHGPGKCRSVRRTGIEQAFLAVREHGPSESAVSTAEMLRRLRYTHSLRRARSALLAGDVQARAYCGPRCVPAAAHAACRRVIVGAAAESQDAVGRSIRPRTASRTHQRPSRRSRRSPRGSRAHDAVEAEPRPSHGRPGRCAQARRGDVRGRPGHLPKPPPLFRRSCWAGSSDRKRSVSSRPDRC